MDIEEKDPLLKNEDQESPKSNVEKGKQLDLIKNQNMFEKVYNIIRKFAYPGVIISIILVLLYFLHVVILFFSGDIPNLTYGALFYLMFPVLTAVSSSIALFGAGKEDFSNTTRKTPIKSTINISAGLSVVGNIFLAVYLIKLTYSVIQCVGIFVGTINYTGVPTNPYPWSDSTALCKNIAPNSIALTISFVQLINSLVIIVLHIVISVEVWMVWGYYVTYLILVQRLKIAGKGSSIMKLISMALDKTKDVQQMDEMESIKSTNWHVLNPFDENDEKRGKEMLNECCEHSSLPKNTVILGVNLYHQYILLDDNEFRKRFC